MSENEDPFDHVRLAMGMTWEQFGDHCGVTSNTLWRLRIGTSNGRALTRRKIEDALGWPHGSILTWITTGTWPKGVLPQRRSQV